jgi:hypothetical protein
MVEFIGITTKAMAEQQGHIETLYATVRDAIIAHPAYTEKDGINPNVVYAALGACICGLMRQQPSSAKLQQFHKFVSTLSANAGLADAIMESIEMPRKGDTIN